MGRELQTEDRCLESDAMELRYFPKVGNWERIVPHVPTPLLVTAQSLLLRDIQSPSVNSDLVKCVPGERDGLARNECHV